jgi:hypothetical protein
MTSLDQTKQCPVCGTTHTGFKLGRNICRDCHNKAQRDNHNKRKQSLEWDAKHKLIQRKNHLMNKYGLTVEEADAMYAKGCEVCGSTDRMCIDHNHKTGKVRGALCSRCNTALGMLLDDPKHAARLVEYIINTTES